MRAILMMLALAACPAFAQGTVPAFVGNKESKVFHLPSCRLVAKIKPENKVWFANRDEARKIGFTPCKICLR